MSGDCTGFHPPTFEWAASHALGVAWRLHARCPDRAWASGTSYDPIAMHAAIDRFTFETVDAVSLLIEGNLQALVVMYSAIDTLAWSMRAEGDVTRQDFISWVEAYFDLKTLGCEAADLYAARCGLVHSASAESNLSRKGDATPVYYATDPASAAHLHDWVDELGTNAKVVGVTALLASLITASEKFSDALDADPSLNDLVSRRVRSWLGFMPAVQVVRRQA
jgi:hypothetical protein